MALTWLALSSQGPCFHIHKNTRKYSSSSLNFLRSISLPKASIPGKFEAMALSFCWSKRKVNLAILELFINGSLLNAPETVLATEMEPLERYTDAKEGFTLLRPSSYVKVDKAGATVLFEEVDNRGNNIGVVVNPVRLTTLGEFGTPQFVAEKLIQAERSKESTVDAEVIGVFERSGHGGIQVYEFEYKVDSIRGGLKRIFSAAFVASEKLYLINITHSDKLLHPHRRKMLEQVLHSFDVPCDS